jgi:hypothetical protein
MPSGLTTTRSHTQRSRLGAARGSSGPAAKRIQHIGRRHDPYQLISIHHRETANEAAAHKIGRSTQRRGGLGAHETWAHEIRYGLAGAHVVAVAPAEIALGNYTRRETVFGHDEMTDTMLAHLGPSRARRFRVLDSNDWRTHQLTDSH